MKKYLAAVLVVLFLLSPVSAFAASSLTLSLSVEEVRRGGDIKLSGTASSDRNDVVVKIVSPKQAVFYIDAITPVQGAYSAVVAVPQDADLAPSGTYTVIAGVGSEEVTRTFSVTDGNSVPENPGNGNGNGNGSGGGGSTGDSGSGAVPAPSDPSGIPSAAGQVSGTSITPEKTADGRYIFGSGTFETALGKAGDSLTVSLPASAAAGGSALEFPAAALKSIQNRNVDLVIVSGNVSLRLPAGVAGAADDRQSKVRIVLNTELTADAKNEIQQSLKDHPELTSSGIVLSVVMEIISASGSVTEIHKLDKPAEVTLKLNEEQKASASADLAGVYAVDGSSVEAVPGRWSNGAFIFTAAHFSYYAILEYKSSFTDMVGHWAAGAVNFLAAKHLVTGVDAAHFEPNRSMTRGEFVTLVMRAIDYTGNMPAKAPANGPAFSDIAAGAYYAQPVTDAAALGIVSGYDGAFRPKDRITREEAVVALVHAAAYFGLNETGSGQPDFADNDRISAWAASAVNQAWSLGLIQGDGKQFNPAKPVSRAEVAVMIQRMLEDRQ
ncbi:S-layer homology domain-containing protein [Paenibacillus sp. XY044]|uniref:S-layer homology domain-containing protein n=1 Tax=Paenibacillus sp. XY044 TaxID=2026089 RepID=UPI0015C62E6E|nr:S-layer homology domain-containing protein [Paenibacillus sp. XY044]